MHGGVSWQGVMGADTRQCNIVIPRLDTGTLSPWVCQNSSDSAQFAAKINSNCFFLQFSGNQNNLLLSSPTLPTLWVTSEIFDWHIS